jgi:cytidylate kinase
MVQRDYNDMHRDIAPLKQADDAILADTTGFEFEDSLALLLEIIKENTNI